MTISPFGSSREHIENSPAFNSWLSKCQSAIQPCPVRQIQQTKTIERLFPIHSSLEPNETIKQTKTRYWGWFGRGENSSVTKTEINTTSKPNSPFPSVVRPSDTIPYSEAEQFNSQSKQGEESKAGFFDELESLLDPIEESLEDKSQKQRCEKYLENLLHRSPMIRFMVKHLDILGCSPFNEDGKMDKIFLTKCENMKGGFMPSADGQPKHQSGLLVCYNMVRNQSDMEAIMSHEMMHWFDHCRFKVDWVNLRHVACSEIRASSLSGECRLWSEFQRGQGGFRLHHQKCARRRAIASLIENPECPNKETAERIVDEVFESCIQDTRPFDEIY